MSAPAASGVRATAVRAAHRIATASLDGRYHIVREIGRGGMATVYLADDPKAFAASCREGFARRRCACDWTRTVSYAKSKSRLGCRTPTCCRCTILVKSNRIRVRRSRFCFSFRRLLQANRCATACRENVNLTPDETVRLGREIALALDLRASQKASCTSISSPRIFSCRKDMPLSPIFGIARAMSGAHSDAFPGALPMLGTPAYMSPEQSQSTQTVDGRSDVYSLGCVLYEMITGTRAFDHMPLRTGGVQNRTAAVPDSAVLYERASAPLASVVMRAMAPEKDARFASAGELARALDETVVVRKPSVWRQKRAMIVYAIALIAVAIAGIWGVQSNSTLDANLIAVAPFDVAEPSLELWKEGLADVMSRNLDGAGPLHTVPVTTVLRTWRGRADAQSARALGERTGAKLVLFGGVVVAGDSIRATALILDASTGNTVAEIERRDIAGRIDRLSDSLTVAVLHELSKTRRVDMERVTSWPTTSIAALKAYLQGEQFYRAALWDSASVHFATALQLDTTFALAYHRLAAVTKWRDLGEIPDSAPYALMRRTSRFPAGLAPRERLLASVDSLRAEVHFAWRRAQENGHDEDAATLGAKLVEVLSDGVLRYPKDAELWFLLADARSEFDTDAELGELDDREILGLYDKAIELDSGFAPAYVKPIVMAAYLDGTEAARRYIRAYLSIDPNSSYSKIIRLDDVLLDPVRSAQLNITKLIDTLPPEGLCEATKLLRHIPDSTEVVVRIADELATRRQRTSASSTFTNVRLLAGR